MKRRRPRRNPRSQPDSQVRPEPRTGPGAETGPERKPGPEPKTGPEPKAHPGRRPRPRRKPRPDARSPAEPQSRPEPKSRPDAPTGPSRAKAPSRSKAPPRGKRRSRPRPTEAIATDQGVATRSQRGAFVETWWAERWVAALERLITPLRLARGRTYARAGQVLSVREDTGIVLAQVQGSRRTPYRVTIGLAPLPDAAWARVFAELSRRPDLAASLLAGEMPRDIDEVFAQAEAALFPTAPDHLRLHCNCPDKVTVCKHIAATFYLIGEQLDEDPFLLFRLRGRNQDEVLEGLRRSTGEGSTAAAPLGDPEPAPLDAATPLDASDFWAAPQAPPRIDLPTERPDLSLLRRLGPFSALDEDLLGHLGPAYRAVAAAAEAAFEAADATSETAEPSGGP